MSDLAVIILAAGKGTRMKSKLPKVLHKVAGRSMLHHVLNASAAANPAHIVVVTGFGAEAVEEHVANVCPQAVCVRQTEQLGTGHAVQQAQETLKDFDGTTIVLYGDVLAVDAKTIQSLHEMHMEEGNAISMLTAVTDDPTGLGRIIRNDDGAFLKIVEEKDCKEHEKGIREVNMGTFMLSNQLMFSLLNKVDRNNAQGEFYLTDIIGLAQAQSLKLEAVPEYAPVALLGVNSRIQQAAAEAELQDRLAEDFMAQGVTMQDPSTVSFSMDTQIGNDVWIGSNVHIGANVKIGSDVTIEGNCHISNAEIADGVTIHPFCHIDGLHAETGAQVGPFSRVRTGTDLAEKAKVGSFVETKKVQIGAGSKVNHLTYAGDATIGAGVNIGAGTVFANYHAFSKEKNKTSVGDGASIGSNTVLVAPVNVGENAFIAASTTVRKDVEAGSLCADKPEQRVRAGYADKFKK